jgi:hypothetical protein
MADDLRYPTGRFAPPSAWPDASTTEWRTAITALPSAIRGAVEGLDDRQLDTPYRDGGWTVRQVVHHVLDSHLNAYCRFKLAMTEDTPTIKPYEEARWAELPDGRTGSVEPSLDGLEGLHTRWCRLLDGMSTSDWDRGFHHPEHDELIPLGRTLAMYAWHGRHHVAHITALRQREGWR